MTPKLNGRLKYIPRTIRVQPDSRFVAIEAFAADSTFFDPFGIEFGSYHCRAQLESVVEENVPGSVLKFHRLTEGPALDEQIVDRFGDKAFVRVAHIAGFMRSVARLSQKGQEGDFGATVMFLAKVGQDVIPLRVGLFDYSEAPTQRFSFGATHALPDIHMGIIAHY